MLRNVKSVFLNITLKSAVENTPFGYKTQVRFVVGLLCKSKKIISALLAIL